MMGSFIGGIVGDAYGSPYEFQARGSYLSSPDMVYNLIFRIPAGSFTDDSSMMLCLAASLIEKKAFNPVDQMQKYLAWKNKGFMSSVPKKGCFDIGNATSMALKQFEIVGEQDKCYPYFGSPDSSLSGNGGIMRLTPIPIYFYYDENKAGEYSILSSKTTHGSQECLEGAELMGRIIQRLLQGYQKDKAILDVNSQQIKSEKILNMIKGNFRSKQIHQIKTSGYVVHSLEAALWAFLKYQSFEDGMLQLAKMGQDVDTVCCIYGQIAGAYYGYKSIPTRWIEKLQRLDLVNQIAQDLVNLSLGQELKG